MTKVLTIFPPNYSAINRAFDLRSRHVIFAFGEIIYNPHRIKIGPELVAHEAVHQRRQGVDPTGWWKRYIADRDFRLAEEVLAHVAEWGVTGDLDTVAERLAAPLYRFGISINQAADLIVRAR